MSATCSGCGELKPADAFYRKANAKNGRSKKCKVCVNAVNAAWCVRNPEQRRAIARRYAAAHPAVLRRNGVAWRERHPDRARELGREYYIARPEIYGVPKVMRRNASKLMATPVWADEEKIAAIYARAKELELLTGIKHHVDHIVPLRSDVVCGLHWEGNLCPIPAKENQRKLNKLIEERA